jgi:phage FluMu gp28-like protein
MGTFLDRGPWDEREGLAPGGSEAAELRASEFARRHFGFEPDEKQTAVLDSQAKRGILNCTRQWGKSTVLAAKAVHRAWTRPGATVLVASPTLRQSGEFLAKAAEFVRALGVRRRGDGRNSCSLALPNGSRIVGLPGSQATVRGYSAVSMLLIDEAAWVADSLAMALQPTQATTDGEFWLISTPMGKRGFFYDVWQHGEGWERYKAPANECPRISPEWLERQRLDMPGSWFAQEYMCEFMDSEDSWFPRDLVEAALSETELPL